jgi:hypothetical protein
MTLAVFDVTKTADNQNENDLDPVKGFTTGTVSHPVPFGCTIRPRSARALELILAEE